MFSEQLKTLRGNVAFRLTFWYSGIFIVSALLLFALAYYLLSVSLNRQDQEAIQLRLKELSTVFRTGGRETLEREVTIERRFEKRNPFFIRLAGKGNRTILLLIPDQWTEFDIKEIERTVLYKDEQWIRLPSRGGATFLEVASVRLSGDYLLQAGKSSEEREKTLKHFRGAFAAVVLPLIFVGFVGGTFLAIRALKPIRHVMTTIRSISTGKMDARVPSPKTGEEFEELVMLFNTMVEKIESLIKGMRNSLDNVAHDLRTPMTRLRGIAEMAVSSDHTPEQYRDALSDCLEESERILKMLSTLMDISEAETGVIKLDRTRVNVAAMIEDVLELYRYVAEEKGLSMETRSPDALYLTADPLRMRQVLGNLLDNAIKYTPEGGKIEIEAQQADERIVILVRDSGIGIGREELDRIWERLYRGDQSRSQKGLGLGLSLVKAIVHAHGGQVGVQSAPGQGSTFTISLPPGK